MAERPVTIFLSAAEASGDEHAARLVEALRRRLPDARLIGVVGPHMAAAGCEVVADLTRQASMLAGPLLRLPYYLRQIWRIRRAIREIRPDVHVPVDSPALNWHLASAAKKAGAKVVYYIAPQVWAWAPWRVRKLARLTDAVACILPFEERYLRHRGVNATYVGHPLAEGMPPRAEPLPDLLEAWTNGTWRVAMLPGSRQAELRGHARAMVATARAIHRRWSKARCTFTVRTESCVEEIRRAAGGELGEGIEIAVGRTREVLAQSHFALAASGTVTLEVAWFGVPMVVIYRTAWPVRAFGRLLGRRGIPTPHFALVNILAGRRIVPELIPWKGKIPPVVRTVLESMQEPGYLMEARRDLLAVAESLRMPAGQSASENAADLIVEAVRARRGGG